jgi:hypothetical protein
MKQAEVIEILKKRRIRLEKLEKINAIHREIYKLQQMLGEFK